MIGTLTLVAFSIGNKFWGLEIGRTMAFVAIGLIELVHSLNIKSTESIFKCGLFENKFLIGAVILGTLMQIIVVIIPKHPEIFSLKPLNIEQCLITIIISVMPVVLMDIQKAIQSSNVNLVELSEKNA